MCLSLSACDVQTIYIIDDDTQFIDIVSTVLKKPDRILKTYTSSDDFLRNIDESIKGIVLLDLELPGASGFSVLEYLGERKINIPVVVLSAYDDWESVRGAFKRGALDFLPKSSSLLKIARLVTECLYLEKKMNSVRRVELEVERAINTLSKREEVILQFLSEGYTSKEISRVLGVAPRTADVHRHNIFRKFQVKSLPQLMGKLAKAGFYNDKP
jgi:FixJ family two-component response regulator